MAMSGVTADDVVLQKFNDIKINHQYQYILMKISKDNKKIEMDKVSQRQPDRALEDVYEDFLQELPEREGRYAIYDLDFSVPDKGIESGLRISNSLLFITWCPDGLPVKEKMMMASSKDALKKKLEGVHLHIQASDKGDLKLKEVIEQAASRKR